MWMGGRNEEAIPLAASLKRSNRVIRRAFLFWCGGGGAPAIFNGGSEAPAALRAVAEEPPPSSMVDSEGFEPSSLIQVISVCFTTAIFARGFAGMYLACPARFLTFPVGRYWLTRLPTKPRVAYLV